MGTLNNVITDSTRELITYGQFTYITSGTNLSSHDDISNNDNFTSIVLSRGLERDGLFIDNRNINGRGGKTAGQITGSFTIDFKSKITPKYEDFNL